MLYGIKPFTIMWKISQVGKVTQN